MPQKDRDRYLYSVFCEFWPPWKSHIDSWEHYSDDTILIKMKNDGYITSGNRYIFGDNGCENWHMERLQHPAATRV